MKHICPNTCKSLSPQNYYACISLTAQALTKSCLIWIVKATCKDGPESSAKFQHLVSLQIMSQAMHILSAIGYQAS